MSDSQARGRSTTRKEGWPHTKRARIRPNFDDDWKTLNDVAKSNSENYDKAVLTVATIALSLGMVFVKEVAGGAAIGLKIVLIFSWFFLALSVGSVIYGYRVTNTMLDLLKKHGKSSWYSSGDPLTSHELVRYRNMKESLRTLNETAGVFLALGLTCSIIFSTIFIIGGHV